jgi:FixJ family two-component response regulator
MRGPSPNPEITHIVLVTAHDDALRGALEFLFRAEGYGVQAVKGGEALLKLPLPERDACIVVDQDLPVLSGLKTIEALRRGGVALPVVLLASRRDELTWWVNRQLRVQVVEKPLRGEVVLEAVAAAFGR